MGIRDQNNQRRMGIIGSRLKINLNVYRKKLKKIFETDFEIDRS